MLEPGLTFSIDNQELFDLVKKEFYLDFNNRPSNKAKQNLELYLGTSSEYDVTGYGATAFWDKHPDLLNYLMEVTYPKDPDYIISVTWMKYYGVDHYSALHQEYGENFGGEDYYINVILIDQSEDLDGGVLVVAGDSQRFDTFRISESIRDRLYSIIFKKPGEGIIWNPQTVHGVTKVNKGHRLILGVAKVRKPE